MREVSLHGGSFYMDSFTKEGEHDRLLKSTLVVEPTEPYGIYLLLEVASDRGIKLLKTDTRTVRIDFPDELFDGVASGDPVAFPDTVIRDEKSGRELDIVSVVVVNAHPRKKRHALLSAIDPQSGAIKFTIELPRRSLLVFARKIGKWKKQAGLV